MRPPLALRIGNQRLPEQQEPGAAPRGKLAEPSVVYFETLTDLVRRDTDLVRSMSPAPDPLSELRDAWTLALNPDALRLLRSAAETGALYRKASLEISQAEVTRTSAEDLTDRLENAGLLKRCSDRPVTLEPTDLGRAVLEFIDLHLGAPQVQQRPTVLVLTPDDREALKDAGFDLRDVLRRAAADIATLSKQQREQG